MKTYTYTVTLDCKDVSVKNDGQHIEVTLTDITESSIRLDRNTFELLSAMDINVVRKFVEENTMPQKKPLPHMDFVCRR